MNACFGRRPRLKARPAYLPTCAVRGRDLQQQLYVDCVEKLRFSDRSQLSRPRRRSPIRVHSAPSCPLPFRQGRTAPMAVQVSSPASARNSAIRSWVDLPMMQSAVIRTAIPPNPSGRIFEQSKELMAVT